MEVAKEELQTALKSIRGRRVERAELDDLVQTTLDETKTRVDGAPIPNATWEYLLRSEILSLAVRLSLISFMSYQSVNLRVSCPLPAQQPYLCAK